MPDRHDKFIHIENMRNFEDRILSETDAEKRELLIRMLLEERKRKPSSPTVPDK